MHQNIVCAKFSILHTLRCKSYKSDRLTNLDTFFVCFFSLPKYFGLRWQAFDFEAGATEKWSQNCAILLSLLWFFLSICVKIVEWSQYCGVKSVLSGVEWVEVKSVLNSTSNLLPPSHSLANSKLINTARLVMIMIIMMISMMMIIIILIIIIFCFHHLPPLLTAN